MMAYMPVINGVIDTSSPTLSAPFICYDDCKSAGYMRQLGTGAATVVRAEAISVTCEFAALAKEYAEHEVNASTLSRNCQALLCRP
jgi:hypothetical protein